MSRKDTHYQIGSDGQLEMYPAVFNKVDDDLVVAAQKAEAAVVGYKREIEVSWLRLAFILDAIASQELYLGRGFETLRAYVESPEIGLTWRRAQDLLILVRRGWSRLAEYVGDNGDPALLLARAGISKVTACLPLLRDEETAAVFARMIERAPNLTTSAVKMEVKYVRGYEPPIDQPSPAVFSARVRRGESFYQVRVTCSDGVDIYTVGDLRVRPHHFPRFEGRFGAMISFADES